MDEMAPAVAVTAPGLTWKRFVLELPVPATPSLVQREFVPLQDDPLAFFARAGFKFLTDHLDAEGRRGLGQALAKEATAEEVPLFIAAWATAGLGHVDMAEEASGRYRFASTDLLLEAEAAKAPACAIALGFMEGLASAACGGRDVLGGEVACRSTGHPACVFVVRCR